MEVRLGKPKLRLKDVRRQNLKGEWNERVLLRKI